MTRIPERTWRIGVWLLLGLWLAMLVLALRFVALDVGLPSVYVEAGDPHPRVLAARPYADLGDSVLRPGDTLVSVHGESLAGVGPVAFLGRAAAPMDGRGARVVYERGGVRSETHLPLVSMRLFRGALLLSIALGVASLVVFLRARPAAVIRWGIPAFLMLAIQAAGHSSAAFPGAVFFVPVWLAAVGLEGPLLLCALTYFPDEVGRELAWVRRASWLAAVHAPLAVGAAYGALLPPISVALPAITVSASLQILALVAILIWKYRRADAIGRRQVRWPVLGVLVASLPILLLAPLVVFDPGHFPWLFDSMAAFAIVPVCLVVAILRYNWFDVDRLISAAASYNVLGIAFVGLSLALAPRVGAAASELLGLSGEAGRALAAFGIAAAVLPGYRRIQPRLERLFFPERHAIDQGAGRALAELEGLPGPGEVTRVLGRALAGIFRCERIAIYAREGRGWVLALARGRAVPPALDPDGRLPARVASGEAFVVDERSRASLAPVDVALLAALGARVVLAVRVSGETSLIACLGAKGSGDVYTPTDLRVLESLAHKAGAELDRFGLEKTLREAREMQDSLRRYVPGAIAEHLGSGAELTSGEREVSVLFVDIRGYTSFSEGRRPEEIFSTVNRYTETVSEIVRRHGGTVVEFNGDGMMTVFGAPRDIAHKERAAVEAGREIVEAVGALPVEGGPALSVGVGIATGQAFVGNIQAVDRMIWSAIGNTTNLAARLQGLTRELATNVVIDTVTWDRAQQAGAGFEKRSEVPIRGRRENQDVYVLPFQAGTGSRAG